ncbi:MAG: TlpA family protein disulfide reductase [Bacteroidia bacterium]|nr:TlpA family protein disulfide reductase [Bacteroidia bacterium]
MKTNNPIFLIFFIPLIHAAQLPEVVSWEQIKAQISKNPDSTYVINFWATWCKPCVQEMPDLWEESEKFNTKKVRFVPISLNFPDEAQTKVLPYIEKNFPGKKFFIFNKVIGPDDIPKISKDWTGAIPFTMIVKGKKTKTFERKLKKGELETELKKLL